MLQSAITFFSLYLAITLLAYISGRFILKQLKNFRIYGSYTRTFVALLAGITTLVVVYSIIRSHFLTIHLFLPLVAFMAFYGLKIKLGPPEINTVTGFKKSEFLLHFPIILFAFGWFACLLFKSGDSYSGAVEYDNALYSQLSKQLQQTGVENRWWMNFTDPSAIKGVVPYHYFDAWLNAFVMQITGVNQLAGFYLITYPLLITTGIYGILAITEHFKKIGAVQVVMAIIFLFAGPVSVIKSHDYQFNTNGSEIALQHYGEKLAAYYPFIFFGILLIINGYLHAALTWLLSLCVISFTLFPALLIFYTGLALGSIKSWNTSRRLLISAGLFFLLVIGFYKISGQTNDAFEDIKTLSGYTDLGSLSIQNTKLFLSDFFYGAAIRLTYFFANYCYAVVCVIYALAYLRTAFVRQMLLLLLYCLAGLTAAVLLYKMTDSSQLFTNTLPFLHCIIITLALVFLYHASKHKIMVRILFLIILLNALATCFFSWNEYSAMQQKISVSDEFLIKVKALTAGSIDQPKAGFIYNQADLNHLIFEINTNYLYCLAYAGINAVPVRLSCAEVNDRSKPLVNTPTDSYDLFYRFYIKNKSAFTNMDSLKLAFIKQNRLKFIVISPTAAIPSFLKENTTLVTDSKTHLRFIRLNNL